MPIIFNEALNVRNLTIVPICRDEAEEKIEAGTWCFEIEQHIFVDQDLFYAVGVGGSFTCAYTH